MKKQTRFLGWGLIALCWWLTACGAKTLPELPAGEIVQKSADRMNALQGFHFIIDRTGAPAYVDPPQNALSLRHAEGNFVAPDKAQLAVKVIGPGLVAEVNVVTIAETQWETNVLTGKWDKLPPNWGFNPAVLFDPQIGLQAILAANVDRWQVVGTETLEGGPSGLLYKLEGQIPGDAAYEMSNQLIGPETLTVQLWIAPETFELYRALVTEPAHGDIEATVWQIDFSHFDELVEITPPQE